LLSSTPDIEPDDIQELDEICERLLWRAQVERQFPTPIEKFVAAAGVHQLLDVDKARSEYLALAPATTRAEMDSAWRKMVGLADITTASLYVSPSQDERSRRKVALHELAHLVLPWHDARPRHVDDARTLSSQCRDRLDIEANAVACELLFQGNHFHALAGGMRPDIDSISRLADLYGAPLDDTARLFTLARRQPVLVLGYKEALIDGVPGLALDTTIGSEYETGEFTGLAYPETVAHDHHWFTAQRFQLVAESHVVGNGYCRRFQCGVIRRGERVWVSLRPLAERVHVLRSVDDVRGLSTST
jgi:hypothetical protein